MEEIKLHRPVVRQLFFWTGIIATIAYRFIIVLNHYSAFWVKVFWYIGTVGFIIYFAHRYDISSRRAHLIRSLSLKQKIAQAPGLDDHDRAALQYLLSSLESTKEKINYIVIFVSSGAALLVGILLDFVVKK